MTTRWLFQTRMLWRKCTNFRRFFSKAAMTCPVMRPSLDFEGAVSKLNELQSNAEYLKSKNNFNPKRSDNIFEVTKFLLRSGLSLEELDQLSVIHVTGTKGKGSTCAFTESILRQHGFKTGLYTSPHLFDVRERICINGKPISKDTFAETFSMILQRLEHEKSFPEDMPQYFKFLTIMAFHIFLEHKVDVAIIEVGIGGEYDCTNVLRKVPVVGFSHIGLDHISILGNTISSIAWNKAGIMKRNCTAFTAPQSQEAMTVLQERSIEKECKLHEVSLEDKFLSISKNLQYPLPIFKYNASLAMALAKTWMLKQQEKLTFSADKARMGLENCVWPGRFQLKQFKKNSYYLDGAHTIESILICSTWFIDSTKNSAKKKVLIFHLTGNRNAESLLKYLRFCKFDLVIFVAKVATSEFNNLPHSNYVESEKLLRCQEQEILWRVLDHKAEIMQFVCLQDSLEFLQNQQDCNVLVTGSLYLVGGVLSIIDPKLF